MIRTSVDSDGIFTGFMNELVACWSCGCGLSDAEVHGSGYMPVRDSAGNNGEAPAVAMTVESVDAALEEVRPYLIADGGDVTVAAVEGGTVMLQLEVGHPAAGFPPSCLACPSLHSPHAGVDAVTETKQLHSSGHRIAQGSLVPPRVPSASVQSRRLLCQILIAQKVSGRCRLFFSTASVGLLFHYCWEAILLSAAPGLCRCCAGCLRDVPFLNSYHEDGH